MSRTVITPVSLPASGAVAEALVNVDQPNGMTIPDVDMEKTVLRVSNTDASAHNLIVRAGNGFFPRATLGDISFTVPATSGVSYIGCLESARFLQSDGSVSIDFSSGFAGKIGAVLLP